MRIIINKERLLMLGKKRHYNLCLSGRMALNITHSWITCAKEDRYKFIFSAFLLPAWLPLTKEN